MRSSDTIRSASLRKKYLPRFFLPLLLLATSFPVSADIVITEIMQNPDAVSDASGEWFEVLNTGGSTINLNGWTIKDNGTDSHVISQDVNVAPGAYAILGRNSDQATNGGVYLDYQYSSITLGNAADELILVQPVGGTVDTVIYDGGSSWPDPTGASMVLNSASLDNNLGSNWSVSTATYGAGDKGTPGSGPDGGGSGGNQAPTANAGTDQSAALSGSSLVVALAGSASDPEGDPLAYQWALFSGDAASATITSATSLVTDVSFSAVGQYVFQLEVNDGEFSDTDLVVVNITDNSSPPTSGFMVFFGNTHSHSEYSDGNKSNSTEYMDAASAFRFARDSGGLDWLIVSDHNHSGAGMQIIDFHKGWTEAALVDGESQDFTAIYGTEWGTITTNSLPDGHVITVSPDLLGWEAGNYDVLIERSDYNSLFNHLASISTFVELAHPHTGDYDDIFNIPYNAQWDAAISLTSVLSGPAFAQETDYSNPTSSTYQNRYYDLLLKGYHLGPAGDQDTHYENWGLANEQRTAVLATENTRAAILEGLGAGRTYATADRNVIVNFTATYNSQAYNMADTVAMDVGTTVTFNVSVTDPDAGDTVSEIELRSGTVNGLSVSNATSVSADTLVWNVTPQTSDPQFYLLRITQADGQKIWTAPIWIDPTGASQENNTPTANFSFSTDNLMANFADSSSDSDGSIVSWSWDFGDGNTSDIQHPSHTYASESSYAVSLTVTDNEGATGQFSANITVGSNVAPTSFFTYSVNALDVDFTDNSSDSDGSIVSWEWDFGDGNTSSSQNPSNSYSSSASYSVSLTVTDDGGLTDISTSTVSTSAPACTSSTHHVDSIVTSNMSVGQGNKVGGAEVTILDSCGLPVSGATVSASFSGGGLSTETVVEVSDGSGVANLTTSGTGQGRMNFTVCVTDVTGGDTTYDSGSNLETCETN